MTDTLSSPTDMSSATEMSPITEPHLTPMFATGSQPVVSNTQPHPAPIFDTGPHPDPLRSAGNEPVVPDHVVAEPLGADSTSAETVARETVGAEMTILESHAPETEYAMGVITEASETAASDALGSEGLGSEIARESASDAVSESVPESDGEAGSEADVEAGSASDVEAEADVEAGSASDSGQAPEPESEAESEQLEPEQLEPEQSEPEVLEPQPFSQAFSELENVDTDTFLRTVNGHVLPTAVPAKPVVVPSSYLFVKRWKFALVVALVWLLAAAAGLGCYYWWYTAMDKTLPVFGILMFIGACAVAGILTSLVPDRPQVTALAIALMSSPLAATAAAAVLHGAYYFEWIARPAIS